MEVTAVFLVMYWKVFSAIIFILFFILLFLLFLDISQERKEMVLTQMNSQFHSYRKENHTVISAYEEMVKNNPYKVLANFSYDWEERPLNDGIEENPVMTDVSLV